MAKYQLTIQLTSEDTHTINAVGQQIVLVKESGGFNGLYVVWVTFSPFESNVVTWEENYGVYASPTEVEGGATILTASTVNPATSGLVYPFESGAFDSPIEGPNNYDYVIQNNSREKLTFGLVQSVIVNSSKFDANPLNALPVFIGYYASFTLPIEKLQVFLHPKLDNGTILTEIPDNALTVDLTSNPSVTIHYDHAQGRFIEGLLPIAVAPE